VTIEELLAAGVLAPDAVSLLGSLLRLLERFGAASKTGRGWQIAETHDLPEITEIWRLLLAEAPDLVAELALTAALTEELPKLLAEGQPQPLAAPAAMVERLLFGSPASTAGIEVIETALGEIATGWPPGRPLRVLEIGSNGAFTRRLLDRLVRSRVAIVYRATHPDPDQAARLGSTVSTVAGAQTCCWSPGERIDG